MRQQYLIWNKDTVSDETIFQDIEKLSDYRIHVPEGLQLTRNGSENGFSKLGHNQSKRMNNQRQRNSMKNRKQRK